MKHTAALQSSFLLSRHGTLRRLRNMCQMPFCPRFGSFNGAYDGHKQMMHKANLNPENNLWFAVFDFNDETRKGFNWSLLNSSEEIWYPLVGQAQNYCPRIEPGSICVPSHEENGGNGINMSPKCCRDEDSTVQTVKATLATAAASDHIFSSLCSKKAATTDESMKERDAEADASDHLADEVLCDAPTGSTCNGKNEEKPSFYFWNISSKFALDKVKRFAFDLSFFASDFWGRITKQDRQDRNKPVVLTCETSN